jgi:hypothetical protein
MWYLSNRYIENFFFFFTHYLQEKRWKWGVGKEACCISGRWKQMEGNREFRLICILGPSSTGKHQYFRCRNEADNFLGR